MRGGYPSMLQRSVVGCASEGSALGSMWRSHACVPQRTSACRHGLYPWGSTSMISRIRFTIVNPQRRHQSSKVEGGKSIAVLTLSTSDRHFRFSTLYPLPSKDGFHHSIQVPSLLNVMPVVDSICRIQSPRYDAWCMMRGVLCSGRISSKNL